MIDSLQTEQLPTRIWESVFQQASRSNLNKYKTGAVIFDDDGQIYGKGCSHILLNTNKPSIHAEEAALSNCNFVNSNGLSIAIMSVGKAGNPSFSSKPCYMCLTRIVKANLRYVFWPERDNIGNWSIICQSPESMYDNAILNEMRVREFARHMRF